MSGILSPRMGPWFSPHKNRLLLVMVIFQLLKMIKDSTSQWCNYHFFFRHYSTTVPLESLDLMKPPIFPRLFPPSLVKLSPPIPPLFLTTVTLHGAGHVLRRADLVFGFTQRKLMLASGGEFHGFHMGISWENNCWMGFWVEFFKLKNGSCMVWKMGLWLD